jgi:hypothetical protein
MRFRADASPSRHSLLISSPQAEPGVQIPRTKWARAHLLRNVADSEMWRSSRKSLLLQ